MEVEQRMRRINNYEALPELRQALQQQIANHHEQTGSDSLPD
jgi:hypothetical protein